ncbi:unnamed protein product [Bemisia tabaci]|uniref:HECT domain-containing protein n=1 Tax=Bemisia tabaci TaxID=7038 RepID=A0A9P0ALP5_BEMTA|nr:unnamed protein product [Bemisia tabaci]
MPQPKTGGGMANAEPRTPQPTRHLNWGSAPPVVTISSSNTPSSSAHKSPLKKKIFIATEVELFPDLNDSGDLDQIYEVEERDVDESSHEENDNHADFPSCAEETEVTLKSLLTTSACLLSMYQKTNWIIDRRNPFKNAARSMRKKSFNVHLPLRITFTDSLGLNIDGAEQPELGRKEEGYDLGGLRREFFTLVLKAIRDSSGLFAGMSSTGMSFHLNYSAPARMNAITDYELAGQLIAMSLVQGGPGPNFFHPHLYEAVLSGEISTTTPDSIVHPTAARHLSLLMNAETVADLQAAVLEESCSQASLTSRPLAMAEKDELVQQFLDFHGRVKLEPILKDLCKGLEAYGLLNTIRAHPTLFKEVFCGSSEPLNAARK